MIRIELPLPPKVLHPNSNKPITRGGMIGLNKAKKKARLDAGYAARKAARETTRWERATIKAYFSFARVTGRGHDQDNLIAWLKHYVDGIVDAGIIADDSGLTWLPSRVTSVGTGHRGLSTGVVLEIEPIE